MTLQPVITISGDPIIIWGVIASTILLGILTFFRIKDKWSARRKAKRQPSVKSIEKDLLS